MESILAIDEMSMELGELKAELRSLNKVWGILDNKLDKIIDSTAVINDKTNKAHSRIDDMEEPLEEAVVNSSDWADTKKKAKWIIGGMGLTGAFSGFSITKAFASWF